MNKSNKILLALSIVLLLILIATYYLFLSKDHYVPDLFVRGDIEDVINLKETSSFNQVKIEHKGKKIKVYKLEDVVNRALPLSEEYELVLSGNDGRRAVIDGKQLNFSYLNYSSENGWEVINFNHPISSNIKLLKNITVVDKKSDFFDSLTIITQSENIIKTTVGELLTGSYTKKPFLRGSSTLNVDGQLYSVDVYSEKRVISLADLVDRGILGRTVIYNKKGETLIHRDGFLELTNNKISYFNSESEEWLEDITGIVLDAPLTSNKDVFYDSLHYLEAGYKVLVVLLDGFGYHQYNYCLDEEIIPFMAEIENSSQAITSYKPVTNTGLAAVLTGKGPQENKIYSRDFKHIAVDDIFKKISKMSLNSVYIEGNIKILNTSIEPILNPDLNQNGITDDEIFKKTLKQMNGNANFVFVHFHGIDDMGHTYGPYGEKTIEMITQSDRYIQELAQNWPGKIIITADHGMHSILNGGDHGLVIYQDMFVPYLITDGGLKDE